MNHHDRNRPPRYPYRGGRGDEHSTMRQDILGSVADAARENPLPAALIGMGALWLFMGGSNISLLGGRGRTSILGVAGHGVGSAVAGAAHMAGDAAHGAAQAGSAVASGVSSAASSLSKSISAGASRTSDYVTGAVHGVDAQSKYRRAGEGNGSPYSQEAHDNSASSLAIVRYNLADFLARHPLTLGFAGLALGMGVAASLPVTETERDALGKARDAVGGKVAEVADGAREFTGAMLREAKQQGLGSRP